MPQATFYDHNGARNNMAWHDVAQWVLSSCSSCHISNGQCLLYSTRRRSIWSILLASRFTTSCNQQLTSMPHHGCGVAVSWWLGDVSDKTKADTFDAAAFREWGRSKPLFRKAFQERSRTEVVGLALVWELHSLQATNVSIS